MKYPLKQVLRWCMLSMAVSASAQVSAPVASTQLPTGGKVMSGTTSIQSVGNVLNINQSSQRSAINWNTFNVGSGAKVNFIQPSASSVTLNRVLDTNGSQILGSINANGQVFISNPNGVLFGPNSQVNVGGLIATTQNISVDDFMAGKSTFEGTGAAGTVVNQGTLEATLGGYIALLAPSVRNEGVVLAREGTVAFAAGDKTVVQFNGPQLVTVMVDRPVLDALVENKQMVRADGGLVIFSARSANAILSSVIKNTGTIQAQTIENKNGRILLIGDMQKGSITVDGKLDASAPTQGDGGFIETSGAQVKIANSAVVTTLAKNGKTGTWLIDPHDYTVAASGGDQTGTQLSTSLGATNVTLQSASGAQTGSGNININDGVSWSANTTLTLTATNNVNVNANVSATGTAAGLAINPNTANQSESASNSGVLNIGSGASISLPNVSSSSTTALVISGTPYTVINSLGAQGSVTGTDFQGMNGNLTKNYALGSNIDASSTSGWNSGAGFTPIAGGATSRFSGSINGLGHSISNIYILSSNTSAIGLIGRLDTSGTIRNIGLSGGSVSASTNAINIGSLVGTNYGSISNSYSSANVTSGDLTQSIGGLVGGNAGSISNSYATGNVVTGDTTRAVGGLTGDSSGAITNSYATGNIQAGTGSGGSSVAYFGGGGFIGYNQGTISDSYATGNISITGSGSNFGGFVGYLGPGGSITRSYATGTVTGLVVGLGGFAGSTQGSTISNSYATGPVNWVNGSSSVGSFVGSNSTGTDISNSYSSGTCPCNGFTGGYGGTITNSFFNNETSGPLTSFPSGVTGINNAQMQSISTFINAGWNSNTWKSINGINNNFPVLSLGVRYVRVNSGSNVYGSTPSLIYNIYDDYSGGNLISNLSISGTPNWNANLSGVNFSGLNSTSSAGNYSINYQSGLNLSNNFYSLATGTSSNWIVNKAPLSTSVAKTYDGNTNFSTGFTFTGAVNADSTPTVAGGSATVSSKNAAIYTAFASNTLTLSDSNYTLTGGTVSAIINQKPINTSVTKTYDGNTTLSSGFTLAGTVSGDATPTVTGGSATVSSKNVATYTAFATNTLTLSDSNYSLTGGAISAIINKKSLTVTGVAVVPKTYDGTTVATIDATSVTINGKITGDVLTGGTATATYSDPNAGTGKVVNLTNPIAFGTDAANYSVTITQPTITGIINKAPVTVTAGSQTNTYTGTTQFIFPDNFTASGLVNGETRSVLTGVTVSGQGLNMGTYPTTASGSATNYSLTFAPGVLKIDPAALVVTAVNRSKTYGSSISFSGTEFSTSGLQPNETATRATFAVSSSGNSATANAGSYSITPSNLTGSFTPSNYSISYSNGTLTVNPAALNITASNQTKTYGGSLPTSGNQITATGLKNSDSATGASFAFSSSGNLPTANVGTYSITPSNLTGSFSPSNYTISYSNGNLTVNPASLSVTASNQIKTYGDAAATSGNQFTTSGFQNSDAATSASFSFSNSGNLASANAGNYSITPSNLTGSFNSSNYNISYANGSLTVNPANLTIAANNLTKFYGNNYSFNGTEFNGVGFKNSDAASARATLSSTGASALANVGNYTISPTLLTGINTNNYNVTYSTGNLIVNPASLVVAASNRTKVYGNTLTSNGNEFTATGLQNSDTASGASFAFSNSGNFATASVGNYSVTPSNLTGSFTPSNYSISYSNGNLTVSPAPLSVTAMNRTKTYGDSLAFAGNEFIASGLKNTDTATGATFAVSNSGTSYTANVGNYAITPSNLMGSFNSNNYSISYSNGNLTVNPAPLNVMANNRSKTYGDTLTFSGTEFNAFGLKNTDTATTASLAVSNSANSATANAGSYAITPSNLAGSFNPSNYNISYSNGTLLINKANATVTGLSGSTEFDGFTKTINGFTASGLVNGETTGDIARSVSNINGIGASVSGRFSGTYLNTPYGTANNYNLNYASGQLVITGCPGGPPCSAIGPQTTVSNITPVVIPAMTAPSFSSAVVTTASPTNSAAPVINFASSSGGGSFGSGGGSTTISSTNTTINSVNATNVTTSSGNPTANASPAASTTTTTIINAGATPANPATNVVNIATNAPSGSTTPTQVNVAQSNAVPTSSPNTVTTTTQNPTSPVAISAAPNNTGTATVSATPNPTTTVNTVNTTNNVNVQASAGTNQAPTNTTSTPTTNAATPQPAAGVVVANNNPNASQVNVAAAQPNVVNPQRLADILSKKDPVEISSALPPTQVAQLSPEQVAPLIDSLSMRQLMSLTNEQIAKFEPARQAELLNIIKVLKDNPEKAADKAFTPTDKTFAQLAANGLLKEQIGTLSTRVTQINQNRTTVNIDTPQKLAELLTKKDPVEIATALPSNQVAQLTPEQAAPLISSLTVRQLLALTNEQISKFDTARQTELLNIINAIKNNPEKAADKAYTAIDKTIAQYVANGLMKDQIDALASKVTQITQSKTTINIDTPQKLAEILSKNNAVEVATALPSNAVPQLTSDQVAPLINALSVKQLLSLTNEQMSKLDPARLAELLNIIKGLKDTPEKAIDKTYTPEDKAVAQYAANGLLKDPIERLSLRANYIANNKSVDPLNKELADLTNPPVPANVPVARNAPNQANRPLNAAQLAAQNANRETPNLTPAQVAALNPKDLGPLLSQLNANQLMAITNAQMASLEGSYLNQLTILLNFVQDRASNPVANATPAAGGNRVNNTNIFINQPVAKLAGAALLADQPNAALPTAPIPAPNPVLAGVGLTPKQVSELDPTQLAALINQLNANQLMAITNAQMARMDGRALNQLTILMNFVQQRTANNNGTANGNNPANAGTNTNTNINVFVNQPVSRLASNALLNEQPKPNAPVGAQSFTQTNITVNLTPRQISELDPTQLAPLISQLNANQLMAITNTQMARMDSQSINQLNILMNFVQQRALNSNTNTTIYINQPVSQIAAASLMNDQPPPTQIAGAAPAPIATVPLSPLQIAGLTPSQVAPLLNRMNSRQLMAVTDTQMASLDSANLNQLITLLNFIQDSARTSPIVTNNFANRPVAGFLPPELNTSQTVTQP